MDGTAKTVAETIDTDRPVALMGRLYLIVYGGNRTPSLRQIDVEGWLLRRRGGVPA